MGVWLLVAGLIAMLNPFTISFLLPSNLFVMVVVAPWMMLVAFRGITRDRQWRDAAAFALLDTPPDAVPVLETFPESIAEHVAEPLTCALPPRFDPSAHPAADEARVLRYAGKLDDNWKEPDAVKERYVRDAVEAINARRPVPVEETFSIGCTIKWKTS